MISYENFKKSILIFLTILGILILEIIYVICEHTYSSKYSAQCSNAKKIATIINSNLNEELNENKTNLSGLCENNNVIINFNNTSKDIILHNVIETNSNKLYWIAQIENNVVISTWVCTKDILNETNLQIQEENSILFHCINDE